MRFGTAIALAAIVAGGGAHARPAGTAKPNVVLILTDDLGWADIGSFGARDIRTPHIDSLARDGVKLTHFYSNGVLCTPTRAALIAGRYQQRSGLEEALPSPGDAGDRGLTATGRSLPRLLRDAGYATALVGKWHLGYADRFSPGAHGFGYFFGLKSGYHDYYAHTGGDGKPDLWENDRQVNLHGYTTDLIGERAVAFIDEHAGRPFFLEVAFNAPHWPYQPPDRPSVAEGHARHVMPYEPSSSSRADYVAMVERVDRHVGAILQALDRRGLSTHTLVIFTNDNGGEWLSDNGPLVGRKWTVWEGGIRVPAMIRWPGRLPSATVSDQVGITMDLTASILAVTGAASPDVVLDGMNLVPILEGRIAPVQRTLFWRTRAGGRNQKAVRHGDWKLVLDGPQSFLFDVRQDPSERQDLTRVRKDVVGDLKVRLDAWEQDVDAGLRSPRER